MSGSLHAWYSLRELESLAAREVALTGDLDLGKLTRLKGLLHSDAGSVRASLRFRQRRDGWVGVELTYQAAVHLVCQRCLEPFRDELTDRVDIVLADAASVPSAVPEGFEPFELEGGRLLPAQLIEDELIVAIPLVAKHARIEDCGGLARTLAKLSDRSESVDR
ncbi:MAG TPA: YceD family protein [Gammaproteobacteria bacterium]